jgi:hypothetical protein
VVSATDPYCRIFGFLDRSLYFFFQVAPQLYSREAEWTPFQNHCFSEKSDSDGNRTRTPRHITLTIMLLFNCCYKRREQFKCSVVTVRIAVMRIDREEHEIGIQGPKFCPVLQRS